VSTQVQLDVAVPVPARLGQAPTWDTRTDSLLWVDVLSNTVHRFTPGDKDHTLEVPQQVSAAKPRSRGGLVLHLAEGIALFEANGEQRTWLVYWAREGVRGGETSIDSQGRLWATTVRHDEGGDGWLARITANGTANVLVNGVAAGSGLAWSPDDTLMYFVDSVTQRIDVFDFDAGSGAVQRRRPLCEVTGTSGRPAGLCTDADGCLWVTIPDGGEVRRYTPDGVLDRLIRMPVRRPTSCCFGGQDLTDLYVTSAAEGLAAPGDLDGCLVVLPGIGSGIRHHAFTG
jgi:sugar lactone lactonase YvrE